VHRLMKHAPVLAAAALLAAGLGTAAPALASSAAAPACGGTGTATTTTGTLPDSATYKIQCPAGHWNGQLFLYSHGYVTPGSANPAQDAQDPVTAAWLLSQGFALAGSSYATTGWAIQQALPDQIATKGVFSQDFGRPSKTIAWGDSLGGIITAGLIQDFPQQFNAAVPLCGVLAGGVATWNTAVDAEFAFQQLVAPSVQVVNITSPGANLVAAETAAAVAQKTPAGQARLALSAALGDTPGWFTPLSPEPAATDFAAQEQNQFLWQSQVDFPFAFDFRAELEGRAGGNPSWTIGVNFAQQLRESSDFAEVAALYRAAGLNLNADLQKLQRAKPIVASPKAVGYLARNIAFNGQIHIPVLSMHTEGDGLVVPQNESAYRQVVARDGHSSLLRQAFVSRAGHCAFTPAETVSVIKILLNRLNTGHWDSAALQPAALNASAAALGPQFNIFATSATNVVPTAPAFQAFAPGPYQRPFDLLPFRL
jgi:pimeloyl-ACP methyl ester carboxylesterase